MSEDWQVEMRRWLDEVCAELDIDPSVLDSTTDPLLDLIRDVAHGPSRPAAPLTAFLVGIAAGATVGTERPADLARVVAERTAAVNSLLVGYTDP